MKNWKGQRRSGNIEDRRGEDDNLRGMIHNARGLQSRTSQNQVDLITGRLGIMANQQLSGMSGTKAPGLTAEDRARAKRSAQARWHPDAERDR